MNMLFPPPNYEEFRIQVIDVLKRAMTVGLLGCALIVVLVLLLERSVLVSADSASFLRASIWLGLGAGSGVALLCLISALRAWMANRVRDLWASNIWEANRQSTIRDAKARETESVAWLNSLISSVWPLINPDLFTSVADMLEDVMQASLPGIIQMVGVEDIGQGSEALRILGIRWLPSGAAARSVGSDGKLESADNKKHAAKSADSSSSEGNQKSTSGEMVPAEADEATGEDASQAQASGGMEAEEGMYPRL
jgi:Ca2+-dependent lipid-binding protein